MDRSPVSSTTKCGLLDTFLAWIAGADPETLAECPAKDKSNVRALAAIMLCTFVYQICLFSAIAHRLFAKPGEFHPEFVLAGTFLAFFILLIDSYMVMRSSWHLSGIAELKRGGIDIGGGILARCKIGLLLLFRLALSANLAQITAIFFGLILFSSDIDKRLDSNQIAQNASTVASVTAQYDATVSRARDDIAAEATHIATLGAQLDALVQKSIDPPSLNTGLASAEAEAATLLAQKTHADEEFEAAQIFATNELAGIKAATGNSGQIGSGTRYRAAMERVADAKAHAEEASKALETAEAHADALRTRILSTSEAARRQTQERLPILDAAVTAARERQAALGARVADLLQNRDATILKAVRGSPNYVERNNGFLAQVSALRQLASSNAEVALVIILIDLTSFVFELAGVFAKVTSFVPTTYSTLLARNAYMQAEHVASDMARQLESRLFVAPTPSPAANDNHAAAPASPLPAPIGSDGETPPTPPKRPRGRPRKPLTP